MLRHGLARLGPRSSPCCCSRAPQALPSLASGVLGACGGLWRAGTGSPSSPASFGSPAFAAHQDSVPSSKRCPRETEARGAGRCRGPGWEWAHLGVGQARCPVRLSRGAHLCPLLPAVRLLPRPLQVPRGCGQRLLQQAALRFLQGQGLHDRQTGPRGRRSPRRGVACSRLRPPLRGGAAPPGRPCPEGVDRAQPLCLCQGAAPLLPGPLPTVHLPKTAPAQGLRRCLLPGAPAPPASAFYRVQSGDR